MALPMPLLPPVLMPTFPDFFITHPAPARVYTLSLHDALPIYRQADPPGRIWGTGRGGGSGRDRPPAVRRGLTVEQRWTRRSEEHTSELQSRPHLVCRLLLEKKNHHVGAGLGQPQHDGLAHAAVATRADAHLP